MAAQLPSSRGQAIEGARLELARTFTMGITDGDSPAAHAGLEEGAVAVLELRDQEKAQKNFLDLLRSSAQDADEVVLEENYQGLKITYAQEKFGPGRNRFRTQIPMTVFKFLLTLVVHQHNDVLVFCSGL